MRRQVLSLLILSVLLGSGLSYGQERGGFNLDNFITEVLERNPSIMGAEQDWLATQRTPDRVGSYEDPMITYTRWLSTPETRVGPQTNVFMLNQRIPFPGKLGKMEDMAWEDATATGEKYQLTRRDVVLMAKQLYYELFRVDASLRVIDDYLQLLKNFLSVAETKYTTGEGIQANVLKTQVELTTVLERQINFRAMRQGLVARINALRDRPESTQVTSVNEVEVSMLIVQDSALVRYALEARQEIGIAQAMVRKSNLAQDLAHLDYYPNFTFGVSYVTIPSGFSMSAKEDGKDPYSVSLGINLPIMLGKRSAAVEETKAVHAASELRLRNVRNMITSEVSDLVSQLRESEQSLAIYQEGLLSQTQSSLESAMSAYQTGKIEYMNLLDAFRMLLQVKLGYIGEQSRYGKTMASLEKAVGGRLPG